MHKAIIYILKGLVGIFLNKNLSISIKIKLYFDYAKLLLLSLRYSLSSKSHSNSGGSFYSKAFNYKIHYPIFPAFFFVFNEIYCIGVYPIPDNIETYIDLGANIGLSVLWYHFFYPEMIGFAFEPDEKNFNYLKMNVEKAGIKNCHLIKKAVSNRVGKHKFYEILDPIQNLDSSLTLNQRLPYNLSTVDTTKLSIFIKKVNKISLIKMDIEGGEYDVFKDIFASGTINRIERIFFESHTPDKKRLKAFAHISKKLKKSGYLYSKRNSKMTSINYWKNRSVNLYSHSDA